MDIFPLYLLFAILLFTSIIYYRIVSGRVFFVVVMIYTVSSLFSIIYSQTFYFFILGGITHSLKVFPLIFWLISFFIIAWPLTKYDKIGATTLSYNPKVIDIICFTSLIISIIPLVELLLQADKIFTSSDIISTVTDIHDDNDKNLNLSSIGMYCFRLLNGLYLLLLLCLIPCLKSFKNNVLNLCGIISGIVVINLTALIISSRGSILATIISLIIVYVLFLPFLSKYVKKRMLRGMILFASISIILFVGITIIRSITYNEKDSSFTLGMFLTRYAGEGFVNFSQFMDYIHNHTNGDYCFWIIKKFLGFEVPFVDRGYLVNNVGAHVGIPMMVFYTFIGFFVIDVGYAGTMMTFFIISLLVTKGVNCKNGVLPFHSLYLLFILSSTIANGTCLYRFTWANSEQLLFMIIFYFFLKHNRVGAVKLLRKR